ncbi:MAG: pseudouridine-5'-phosphate glycosidase [Chloroflexota bacterium]
MHDQIIFQPEVRLALEDGRPVVALESTVITHGLPYPYNRQVAEEMEAEIRSAGAVPATLALLDGRLHAGVTPEQLERLAQAHEMHKISRRDYAPAMALGWSGGTTVAGTMLAAQVARIRVFATGGVGGVHHFPAYDISADLPELAQSQVLVVCAGAKAILNLDATLEYLETAGVPVIGYQTDEFPAFYSRESGLPVSVRADSPAEAAAIARAHWRLPGAGGLLVGNPPPVESALPRAEVEQHIQAALAEAAEKGVRGQAVSPFLLSRVAEMSGGASMTANMALLRNNARLAAQIAWALAEAQ